MADEYQYVSDLAADEEVISNIAPDNDPRAFDVGQDEVGYRTLVPNCAFYAPYSADQINSIESATIQRNMRKTMQKFEKPYYPSRGKLNDEQYLILIDALLGKNIGIFGSAGVGKSVVLHQLVLHMRARGFEVAVTATTGSAAVNLGVEATTLHAFMGCGLCEGTAQVESMKIREKATLYDNWASVEVLIIEEVSMLSPQFFDKFNHIAQLVRDNRLPFGGIQVIVCGDFAQLDPVIPNRDKLPSPYCTMDYCFETAAWKAAFSTVNTFLLTENYRQKTDPTFIRVLEDIRFGHLSPETVNALKSRVSTDREYDDYCVENSISPTIIFPKNNEVDQENTRRLNMLPGAKHTFAWSISVRNIKNAKTAEQYKSFMLKKMVTIDERFSLKIGASVILLKNLNLKQGLCNGTQGVVTAFEPKKGYPVVKFANGVEMTVEPAFWTYSPGKKHVNHRSPHYVGVVLSQIPLKLGFAITVHKVQGMTIQKIRVDTAGHFSPGQLYTALTRCPTLAGISLKNFDPKSFIFGAKVIDFYTNHVTIPRAELAPILVAASFFDGYDDLPSSDDEEPPNAPVVETMTPAVEEQKEEKKEERKKKKRIPGTWKAYLKELISTTDLAQLTMDVAFQRLVSRFPEKEKKITKRKKRVVRFVQKRLLVKPK